MSSMTKDQMNVILSVLSIEEFDEYQMLLETRIYHSTLTTEEESRIKELSNRLMTAVKASKNIT